MQELEGAAAGNDVGAGGRDNQKARNLEAFGDGVEPRLVADGKTDGREDVDGTATLYAKWTLSATPLPVHRFYSKAYKGHFFTIDEAEKDGLIANNPNWRYEGVAYLAFTNRVSGTVPLFRFWSKGYRGHFYTVSEAEMRTVRDTNPNWRYEGVAYYVDPGRVPGSVPVHRFWSKAYRHHFYTTDEAEKDDLIAHNPNWAYEGVAFWALLPAEVPSEAEARRTARDAGARDPAAPSGGKPEARKSGDPDFAPWILSGNGEPVAVPGVTEIDGTVVETRADAPDADELAAPSPHSETCDPETRLRLALPDGAFGATLWSAADGTVADETAEGAFVFDLPASGVWHWLRIRDAGGEEAFSVWLRAE